MDLKRHYRYYIKATGMALIGVPLITSLVAVPGILIFNILAAISFSAAGGLSAAMYWLGYIKGAELPERLSQILMPVFIFFCYYMLLWIVIFGMSGYSFTGPLYGKLFLLSLPFFTTNFLMAFVGSWVLFPVIITALALSMLAAVLFTLRRLQKRIVYDRRLYVGVAIVVCILGIAAFQNHERRLRFLWPDWHTQRVGHEVDTWRYRPFAADNNLVKLPDPPTVTFTENFPRLDGATAAYPVFAAIAQALYVGLDECSVRDYVNVSRTDAAYYRLINDQADIFFGAQPSPPQLEAAREAGVEFTMTPVAREAFVFFVHRDNPVDNLSLEQIQDIYRRRITNWREVGGANERIIPFQRPENSGSQTIMLAMVMMDVPIAYPQMEERAGGMGDVIHQVAVYRNYSSAIGYSFRYFVTGMRPHDDIKLLSVDGVAPTLENIRNGTYPFIINVYAVTAGTINENAEKLIRWILSEQGQAFIELCGVVPIN